MEVFVQVHRKKKILIILLITEGVIVVLMETMITVQEMTVTVQEMTQELTVIMAVIIRMILMAAVTVQEMVMIKVRDFLMIRQDPEMISIIEVNYH